MENYVSGHNLNVDKLKDALSREEFDIDWINEVIGWIYIYDEDQYEIICEFDCLYQVVLLIVC